MKRHWKAVGLSAALALAVFGLGAAQQTPGLTGRGMNLCARVEELSRGQVERRIAALLLRSADQVGVARGGE